MARLQFFFLIIAVWILAINGAPIQGTLDQPNSYTLETTATLRELIHEFTKRHHRYRDRNGPWHASNGEPLSMWSSQFWMSLANRPSTPCPLRQSHSGSHYPHPPHRDDPGPSHHPHDRCGVENIHSSASNAKDVFIVIVLSSTALLSMYLTCKVMNVCSRR